MTVKLIFLDCDGVMNKGLVASNSNPEDVLRVRPFGWMNISLINNLNRLTDTTQAKLVISSSWRLTSLVETQNMMSSFGIKAEVIGQTPELASRTCRGDEIQSWIDEHLELLGLRQGNQFMQYIILDDTETMLPHHQDHYIQTDPFAGLTPAMVDRSINMLNTLKNKEA